MALDDAQRSSVQQALREGQTPWDAIGESAMDEREVILSIWEEIPLADKTEHIRACRADGRTPKDAARLLYLDLRTGILPVWRVLAQPA